MPHIHRLALTLCAVLLLGACAGLNPIKPADVETTPTVYAKVLRPPNPLLLGYWRREQPAGIEKPWVFNYWLVKKGDRYAVYYHYDSRKKNSFSGWADFTIDGDTMTSGVDGTVYFVQGGEVKMRYPGRDAVYDMNKLN